MIGFHGKSAEKKVCAALPTAVALLLLLTNYSVFREVVGQAAAPINIIPLSSVIEQASIFDFSYGKINMEINNPDKHDIIFEMTCTSFAENNIIDQYWVISQEVDYTELPAAAADRIIFISASHINLPSEYSIPLLAYIQQYGSLSTTVCVSMEAQLNVTASISDTMNVNINWLSVPSEIAARTFISAGYAITDTNCYTFSATDEPVQYKADDIVVMASIIKLYAATPVLERRSSVWISKVEDMSTEICWNDYHTQQIVEQEVKVPILMMQKQNTQNNANVSTGRVEFEWLGDETYAAVCIQVPLEIMFIAEPYVFVTLENRNNVNVDDEIGTELYLWINGAFSQSFEVCAVQYYGARNSIPFLTKFAIHYLVIGQEHPSTDLVLAHMSVSVEARCNDFSHVFDPYPCNFTQPWPEKAEQNTLLAEFFANIINTQGKFFATEYVDPGNGVINHNTSKGLYYFTWFTRNFETESSQIYAVMNDPANVVDESFYINNTQWNEYLTSIRHSSMSKNDKILYMSVTAQIGSECEVEVTGSGDCSVELCSESGGEMRLALIRTKRDPLNIAICSDTGRTVDCNFPPCNPPLSPNVTAIYYDPNTKPVIPASQSGLSAGATAAIVIVVLILVGIIGYLLYRFNCFKMDPYSLKNIKAFKTVGSYRKADI